MLWCSGVIDLQKLDLPNHIRNIWSTRTTHTTMEVKSCYKNATNRIASLCGVLSWIQYSLSSAHLYSFKFMNCNWHHLTIYLRYVETEYELDSSESNHTKLDLKLLKARWVKQCSGLQQSKKDVLEVQHEFPSTHQVHIADPIQKRTEVHSEEQFFSII